MRTKKLNEGFWDAISNSVKTLALNSVADLSASAKGKAQAMKLATGMYNSYKEWLGKTGGVPTPASMGDFFTNHTGEGFGQHAKKAFAQFAGLGIVSDTPGSKSDTSSNDQEADLSFSHSPEFKEFLKQIGATGFSDMVVADSYSYNKKPDGSIIQVDPKRVNELRNILKSGGDVMAALYANGFLTTWKNFKSKSGVSDKSESKRMVFAKNALMTADELVGKNYLRKYNRFIVAKPSKDYDFNLTESTLMEFVSDGDIRKFMIQMAADVYKMGINIGDQNTHVQPEDDSADGDQAEPEVSTPPKSSKKESTPTPAKSPIELTPDERQVVDAVDRDVGIENLIKSSNPEVEKIVKKIVGQAIKSFKDEVKKK